MRSSRKASPIPAAWLNYGGDYGSQRHSPLTQITPANVGQLSTQWAFQTAQLGKFEATPIVLDGVMYVTGPNNSAWAIDARTGRQIWRYVRDLPEGMDICCGRVNRGFAVLGDRLFMNTLDAHLLAFDMKTGAVVWDSVIADYKQGYSATVGAAHRQGQGRSSASPAPSTASAASSTPTTPPPASAPGASGWCPAPARRATRRWEGDSWKRGGGSTWVTGSYDPALNLIYWGTGNPGPDLYGNDREGDNLYTDSVVALDADTGVLQVALPVHAARHPRLGRDAGAGAGRRRRSTACRGRCCCSPTATASTTRSIAPTASCSPARPFVKHDLGRDDRPRRPARTCMPNTDPTERRHRGVSRHHRRHQLPVAGLQPEDRPAVCHRARGLRHLLRLGAGVRAPVSTTSAAPPSAPTAASARCGPSIPVTGSVKWEFKYYTPSMAGVLSTESGLVFGGDMDGNVMAFEAATGKNLWHFQTGSGIYAAPITYMLDGRQWVVMPSGTTLYAFALPRATRTRMTAASG